MAAFIILLGNLLGIGIFIKEEKERNIKYLERNSYGEGGYEETLFAEIQGKTQEITVYVEEESYTEKEIEHYIKEAKKELDKWLKKVKKGGKDFRFPQSLEGNPVKISWSTGNPEILSWEGILGEDIPEKGENVEIVAFLSLGEGTEIWQKKVTVYPPSLSEKKKLQKEIQKEAELLSENPSEPLYLPQTVRGEEIRYRKTGTETGRIICIMSLVLGLGVYPLQKEKEKKKQELVKKEMQRDYPDIIQKLVLFLRAGFTIRKAMEKIADGYLRSKEKYHAKERSAYEEIVRTCKEMQGGIYEAEAYERFGVRCGLSQYKVLSVLLVQNLKKGNQNLLELLEREEAVAEDERKRSAKVRGEEASTKLLLPMVLQLIVVLMILMIPAFFSFL
ncbi:MAG: type II secretion system F family protein [Blautia sp.]|nr:type II secretion system F family protein [Blautia sp.]